MAAVVLLAFSGGFASLAHADANQARPTHRVPDHSCCPRVHPAFVPPIAVEVPPLPCRERPCCVSHGQDAPPSLPATSGTHGPGMQPAFGEKTDTGPALRIANATSSSIVLQPYSSSSMVLRI